MRSIALSVILLAGVGQASSPAQAFIPGDTVRLNGIRASLIARRGDTLEVRFGRAVEKYSARREARKLGYADSDSTTLIAIPAVQRIEVLRGRRSAGKKYAGIGAVLGFLVGGVIGASLDITRDCQEGWFDFCDLEYAGKHLGNGLLLGTGAALVAGGIGYLVGRQFSTDNWVAVGSAAMRPALVPRPGGAMVGITLRL